jgi:protein-disulfide isomerase
MKVVRNIVHLVAMILLFAATLSAATRVSESRRIDEPRAEALDPAEASRLGLLGPQRSFGAGGSQVLGRPEAPVALDVFIDLECPHGIRFVRQLPAFAATWPTELRVTLRPFPIPSHPSARIAAEALLASEVVGAPTVLLERIVDRLDRKERLGRGELREMVIDSALDPSRFELALDEVQRSGRVDRELQEALDAGISSAPTLFVDGWRWSGPPTIDSLRPVVELLLATKGLRIVRHVTRLSGTDDGECDDDCSLVEAIDQANRNRGAELIRLPTGSWALAQSGPLGVGDLPPVSEGLTILGSSSAKTVLEVVGEGEPFVRSKADVPLSLAEVEIVRIALPRGTDSDPSDRSKDRKRSPAETLLLDSDGDGVENSLDCRYLDPSVWFAPGEAPNFRLWKNAGVSMSWGAPSPLPGNDTRYDLLRSSNPSSFLDSTCLLTNSQLVAATDSPGSAPTWYYLVRSRNRCGSNIGTQSDSSPREALLCPAPVGEPCSVAGECTLLHCCNGSCVDVSGDPLNCGSCGFSCSGAFPHSLPSCSAGSCIFGGCQTNWWNLNGNTADGCEYACTYQSSTDIPDEGFVDANCDGIDGNVSSAVFVATTGNDSWAGTREQPVMTISRALLLASANGKTQVLVSAGTYSEVVDLRTGVGVFGGYSAVDNWTRSASYETVIQGGVVNDVTGGRVTGVDGRNLSVTTIVDRVTINTTGFSGGGKTSYGVYCSACSGVVLSNVTIYAANGKGGSSGYNGSLGAGGGTGGTGGAGSCDNNTSPVAGGGGGSSTCGRTGGAGGAGMYGTTSGTTGSNGVGGALGGAGGSSGNPGGDGAEGAQGANGVNGSNGSGGSGGFISSGYWQPHNGGSGASGGHAGGGGGGGGGGGQSCTLFCVKGTGNGGGGGGGGGCGGTQGGGGYGGGGSFGIFLVDSTGFQLVNSFVQSGNGGAGGSGGSGGFGGGPGGPGLPSVQCSGEVGVGGNGGIGGQGGRGGHGGGGAGGPSWAVYRVNTSLTVTGNTLTHGTGGAGGGSEGNPGVAGASGTVN